jgi:IS605 OrfB family transposase
MKSIATMKIKIPTNPILLETMKQYSQSAQEVMNVGFEKHLWNKIKLHNLTYYKIREATKLPAQLVCSSRDKACETLKSVFRNKGSKPIFKKYLTIRYDARSFSFKENQVSLCSVKGRIKIQIKIPEYYRKYLDWKVCSADLVYDKKKRMFLNVVVSKDISIDKSSNGKVVGVDIGINHLAVTSDKRFFSYRKVRKQILKLERLRSELQAKGTPSAKRHLKKLSGREKRFKACFNHKVSKAIVSKLKAGDTIVMERIKHIRRGKKGRRYKWLNKWSFYQFQKFIEYKAIRKGIRVIYVNPRNTSKRCSRCGSLNTERIRGFFHCLNCGYSLNSHLNASFNLANLYGNRLTADVNQRIVSSDELKGSMATEIKLSYKPPILIGGS